VFLAYFLPFFCLTVFLQVRSGVYSSELAHYPDEPAHVVSALMVHDYIAHGIPQSPLRYAETYYLHYPKVAIGVWPPVFHTLGAIWMLIFSTSHRSMLMFMATQCSLAAVLVAFFTRRWTGWTMGFLAGCLFITFYLVQYGATMFMLDLMLTLIELTAVAFLIRFFKTERTWDALGFGVMTTIGMLTKGNAMALILVPFLMIILLGRWSILKKPGLYLAAVIVVVVGAPWQFVTIRMLKDTVPLARFSLARLAETVSGYSGTIVESTGYIVLCVAVAGAIIQLWRAEGNRRIETIGLVSLAASVFFLHVGAPYPWDGRYVTPMLPVIAIFFAAGIVGILNPLVSSTARRAWVSPLAAILLMAIYAKTTFATPVRTALGYVPVAESLTGPNVKDSVILVSADGFGEGALVSEVALHEARPGSFVLRGSKVINEGRWSLRVHESLLKTPEEMQKYLLSVPVDTVVIDRTSPLWQQDTDMLLKTMADNPQSWRLAREIPAAGTRRNILVFGYFGPRDPSLKRDISVRMRFVLGKDLKN
jgi:Dolichyl-phosphate-mannose-protein mannosyltransferase